MLATKAFLCNLLSTDATILSLVDSVDNICYSYPNSFESLPVLAYMEDNAPAGDYFDNRALSRESNITIDVYTAKTVSTSPIVTAVENVLENNLYNINFSGDVPDPDTKLNHRVIKANRKFTADDLD